MKLFGLFKRGARAAVPGEPQSFAPTTFNADYSYDAPTYEDAEQSAPAAIDIANLGGYCGPSTLPANQGVYSHYDGDKWCGSFGDTKLYDLDYWTLRQRSAQLFYSNTYAKGLIRRLVTNIINVGLHLECEPEEGWLGLEEDSLADWSERTETQFMLWGDSPSCDHRGRESFGRIQARVKRQAIVEGDVLVIIHTRDGRPIEVETISGDLVQTPIEFPTLAKGHTLDWGVEWDAKGREIAYWVTQADETSKRIPARGRRSGRRIAKLVRGFDGLNSERRGEPLLGILLQSIRDLDRYRDAAIRKATINALITAFIKKTEDKPGTKPMTGGAVRREDVTVNDPDGTARTVQFKAQYPGLVMETLQQGEEPVVHSTAGTDSGYGDFESAVIHAMAWACEMPPEILELAFSSNYSASQAALQEFIIFLNKERAHFADELLKWVYEEWTLTESMAGRLDRGATILRAWREPAGNLDFRAWLKSEWYGAIKPSTDPHKMEKALAAMVHEGALTRDRMSRMLTGTKYSKNIKKLKRENAQLKEVRDILAPEVEEGADAGPTEPEAVSMDEIRAAMAEALEDHQS